MQIKPLTKQVITNERWLEIQFYFFCRKIVFHTKTIYPLNNLISGLNYNKKYNETVLHNVVTDFFIFKNHAPHLVELVILHEAHPTYLSRILIRSLTKVKDAEIDKALRTIRRNKLNITSLHSLYPPEVHTNILLFFRAVRNISLGGILPNV